MVASKTVVDKSVNLNWNRKVNMTNDLFYYFRFSQHAHIDLHRTGSKIILFSSVFSISPEKKKFTDKFNHEKTKKKSTGNL